MQTLCVPCNKIKTKDDQKKIAEERRIEKTQAKNKTLEFKKTKKTEEDLKERKKFIIWLEAKDLKPRTVKNYLFYYDKIFPASNLNQDLVEGLVERYKNNSIVIAFINNYRLFILTHKKLFKSPTIKAANAILLPKKTGTKEFKIPEVITESQTLQIEKCFKAEKEKLMLLISFYSGVRLGGLVNIRPHSFDWNGWYESEKKATGRLKVIEKGMKERIVFIPTTLMGRIEFWVNEQIKDKAFKKDGRLFKTGARHWQYALAKASREVLNHAIHPHTLRHSFATYALNKGMKIEKLKEILGHKDISTTMIYTKITQADIEKDYDRLINF